MSQSRNLSTESWSAPDTEAVVRIENVTKRFGDTYAVDDMSLDIHRGEFFSLLGASGCGKTTLLRMLAGFESPTAGRIFIDGQDMTNIPAYKRPVNMMFQSYALFPHMTVAQNIAYGLKNEPLNREERRARVIEMM
ncbi:MAG: ATP-binding cassette domain-containing protein, partial [Thalassolituus sp.]